MSASTVPAVTPIAPSNRTQRAAKDTHTFVAISLRPWCKKPALPAFTTDHRMLVVPSEGSDNVAVVSLEQLAVVEVISLSPGSRPWQAKVIPRQNVAYVTNSRFAGTADSSPREPSTVSVLDLELGKVVREIQVGAGANGVTVDQKGRRGYVTNMRSNTVSVIDVANHSVVATLPTGVAPAFAKLSRDLDGRYLLVTNLAESSVSVFDTAELRLVKTVQVGVPYLDDTYPEWGPGDTTGVAVSESGIAYLTNYRSHTLGILNLADFELRRIPSPIRFPFFVEIERRANIVLFSSGIEKTFALLDGHTLEWLGTYRNDGTQTLCDRAVRTNIWMTDPDHDRITAILPRGVAGVSDDWESNMVTKFM